MLQTASGNEIVGAVPDGATALDVIKVHEPDVAVLDITMPALTGLDILEALTGDASSTRVVFLTASAL